MRAILTIIFVFFYLFNARSQERHWSNPDYLVLQYAGSIGYLSGGIGYNVFKHRARASLHFGHVPKAMGGPLNIFATKFIFVPRKPYRLSDRSTLNAFDFGLMVSYHLGDDFRSTWPEHRYPERYYWWQTSFRFHLHYQPSVTIKIRDHTTFKAVTGYMELNTNELYLVSLFQNLHALKVWDVMKLGAGVRLHF